MKGYCRNCKFYCDLEKSGICNLCIDLEDYPITTKYYPNYPKSISTKNSLKDIYTRKKNSIFNDDTNDTSSLNSIKTYLCIYCSKPTFNNDHKCTVCKSDKSDKTREFCENCDDLEFCENGICNFCKDSKTYSKTKCLICLEIKVCDSNVCKSCSFSKKGIFLKNAIDQEHIIKAGILNNNNFE